MSEQELGRDARALLSSAQGAHDAPSGAKDRVRVAIAAAVSAPVASGVSAAAVGTAAPARWLTSAKLTTFAVIVGVGAAAILLARHPWGGPEGRLGHAHGSAEAPLLPPSTPALPGAPALGSALSSSSSIPSGPIEAARQGAGVEATRQGSGIETSSPAPEVPVTTPDNLPPAPPPSPHHSTPASTPAAATHARTREVGGDGSVAAEVTLLRRASAALRAGDPKGALAAVSEHAHRFPNGALAEERDTERIVALCALGRGDEAARAMERFKRSYPSSAHEARIRAACSFPAPSSAGGAP
jgi:hypothetical protein